MIVLLLIQLLAMQMATVLQVSSVRLDETGDNVFVAVMGKWTDWPEPDLRAGTTCGADGFHAAGGQFSGDSAH
jgi:hypothetical protein